MESEQGLWVSLLRPRHSTKTVLNDLRFEECVFAAIEPPNSSKFILCRMRPYFPVLRVSNTVSRVCRCVLAPHCCRALIYIFARTHHRDKIRFCHPTVLLLGPFIDPHGHSGVGFLVQCVVNKTLVELVLSRRISILERLKWWRLHPEMTATQPFSFQGLTH